MSNFTILGGAIANTMWNAFRRHPERPGPLIDWDLILAMEPLTIFGAVFGSLLSKRLGIEGESPIARWMATSYIEIQAAYGLGKAYVMVK